MFGTIVLYTLIILFIIIIWLLIVPPKEGIFDEGMIDIKPIDNPTWSRSKCRYKLGETLQQVLDENKINKVNSNGTMHLACSYDQIDSEIDKLYPTPEQRVFIIENADHISAKDYLWKRMVDNMGLAKAKTVMPNTYILNMNSDRERLKNEYDKNKLYIMKKNIQRQEGLKITDSLDEILNASSSYVIVQELLQDPYTINIKKDGKNSGDHRKINMRFYILVICKDDKMDVYVYNDGFMYYTKESFKRGSKEEGPNITTGYIERWIYEQNPLTHTDFKKYLDSDRKLSKIEKNIRTQGLKISNVVFNRIYNLLREVLETIVGKACNGNKLNNNISFQLFGADIAINDQLWPSLMEINKGPDMSVKDDRDGNVKRKCIRDMLRIVGMINNVNDSNGFIQIINKEGNEFKLY